MNDIETLKWRVMRAYGSQGGVGDVGEALSLCSNLISWVEYLEQRVFELERLNRLAPHRTSG